MRVLVRGSGDVGSAVAHRLFRAGYAVVIHDAPQPTATRRAMAFTDAVFDNVAQLEGVVAIRVDDLSVLPEVLERREVIPVAVQEFVEVLQFVQPDVLVDARMRKRAQPEVQRGLARLTIGLGPNFVAGTTTDLAVETSWGEDLGKVIEHGATRPLAGEPRFFAGYGRGRFVYAPTAGIFTTVHHIGDAIQAEDEIARIGDSIVRAPLAGVLRGLTRNGVAVTAGTKVVEVDPRGAEVSVSGLGERPSRIAEGVLAALDVW